LSNLQNGGDGIFAQHIGEYLATDSDNQTGTEESAEIIFDANDDMSEEV
jgi:hypothetical protein